MAILRRCCCCSLRIGALLLSSVSMVSSGILVVTSFIVLASLGWGILSEREALTNKFIISINVRIKFESCVLTREVTLGLFWCLLGAMSIHLILSCVYLYTVTVRRLGPMLPWIVWNVILEFLLLAGFVWFGVSLTRCVRVETLTIFVVASLLLLFLEFFACVVYISYYQHICDLRHCSSIARSLGNSELSRDYAKVLRNTRKMKEISWNPQPSIYSGASSPVPVCPPPDYDSYSDYLYQPQSTHRSQTGIWYSSSIH